MMTKAWMVTVAKARPNGLRPMLLTYYAAFFDKDDAKKAVRKHIQATPRHTVMEPTALTDEAFRKLGLRVAEVRGA